eukprot:365162-Chlamydomonas_euryale.AAC.18
MQHVESQILPIQSQTGWLAWLAGMAGNEPGFHWRNPSSSGESGELANPRTEFQTGVKSCKGKQGDIHRSTLQRNPTRTPYAPNLRSLDLQLYRVLNTAGDKQYAAEPSSSRDAVRPTAIPLTAKFNIIVGVLAA